MKQRQQQPFRTPLDRNLAMELVRVTEAPAMASSQHMGLIDKNLLDGAAVGAMRHALGSIAMDRVVVIGEGEKDEAPILYNGERTGNGPMEEIDIAVDPIDGTTMMSESLPEAIAVVAMSARGTMNVPRGVFYMNKIVVGPEACDAIDINASIDAYMNNIAKAKQRRVGEITVVCLDRLRHDQLLREIRVAGARIKLISDGDIASGIHETLPHSGADVLVGIGGAPEGVISAAAIRCTGGAIQCKPCPRDEAEKGKVISLGQKISGSIQPRNL